MERDSSDEEDRLNLIDDNEPKLPPRSGFHIEDFKSRLPSRRFSFNKRYLFAIFPPLFILLIYFTTDVRNLFATSISVVKSDSPAARMRESELRALYLLRQQQLSLFSLWNHSAFSHSDPIPSNSSSNSTTDSSSADFKSALLKQISLNKEIQQVLLSSHSSGNLSDILDDNRDLNFGGYGFSMCPKVNQNMSQRPVIQWKPRSDKYLFAICLSGQMSNHLICLEKHMFFAALLNRILVIPSSKFDYPYNRVLDMDHVNKCLGRTVVLTFEEFAESKKNHIHIDRVLCYFSLPVPCYVDEDHVKKLKSLGISIGKLEPAWAEDIKRPTKRTAQDVQAKFSSNDDVIAIGDVFFANVEEEWVMQPGGPIAHKCQTLIEPSRLIMLTAQRFVQTFLGKSFTALHFRRHGFLKFCNVKETSCFFPIPQAADCISRVVERANTPVIYLSTDAAESETGLLKSLVVLNGKHVPLITRPPRNSAEKWDALLYRHSLDGDPQVGLSSFFLLTLPTVVTWIFASIAFF